MLNGKYVSVCMYVCVCVCVGVCVVEIIKLVRFQKYVKNAIFIILKFLPIVTYQ